MSVKALIRTYETALNHGDVNTIMALYDNAPVFMPQHSPALIGRDAVRTGYEDVFAAVKLNVRLTIHEVEKSGEWAWVRTSSTGRTRTLAHNAEVDEGNNELFILKIEGREWKIHRYLFATTQPRM